MNYRCIALSAALAIITVPSVTASAGEPRAVIELFTSQGCSSCPPADKVLGELARDPSLITLSLAVDYWDYLGWKDTLAVHGHSTRERAYAEMRGDHEVFTPQVVVDGIVHVLGSDKVAIEASNRGDAAHRAAIDAAGDGSDCRRQDHGQPAGRRRRKPQRRSLALPGHRQGDGGHWSRRERRSQPDIHQCCAPLGQARRLEPARRKHSASRWPRCRAAISSSRISTKCPCWCRAALLPSLASCWAPPWHGCRHQPCNNRRLQSAALIFVRAFRPVIARNISGHDGKPPRNVTHKKIGPAMPARSLGD